MQQPDEYRVKAAELRAKASRERDPQLRTDLENLANAYLRLAEQAERNQRTDVSYETPPEKSTR